MKYSFILMLALGLAPLSAQDLGLGSPYSSWLFNGRTSGGVQGLLVLPQAGLRSTVSGRSGFQVGVHAGVALDGNAELRPRIDYTRLDGGSFSVSDLDSTTTVQEVSLGADYMLFIDSTERGLYGVVGAGLAWWQVEHRFSDNTHQVAPAAMVGTGFRFNRTITVEVNAGLSQFRPVAGSENDIRAGAYFTF